MPTYYPRWALNFSVPVAGSKSEKTQQEDDDSVVNWTMPVQRFRWEKNDHTQADVLSVVVDWNVAGVDPRMITDGVGQFFIDNASDPFNWRPGRSSLRFAGIVQNARRVGSEDGMLVELKFHDYTSLFLAEKPFVSKGVPDYAQTLSQAWARICDHVGPTDEDGNTLSVVGALRDRLVFEGDASDVVLGKAVAQRFRGAPIVPRSGFVDAWAVWQQCVGMCGLISFIRLDTCVVTTSTDYYTEKNPARLIWGRNIAEIEEERDVRRAVEGVILTSYDPMTGTTIEALWPPIGDSAIKRKHLSAKKLQNPDAVRRAESRIAFSVPGITDDGVLLDIAKRVHAERSRQELEGRVVTSEMIVEANDGTPFDLLTLGAGEVVRIEIEQDVVAQLLGVDGEEQRISVLVAKGYDEGVAKVLVRNLESFQKLSPKFFTRRVIVSADSTPEGGRFDVEVHYCNRITPIGDANVT